MLAANVLWCLARCLQATWYVYLQELQSALSSMAVMTFLIHIVKSTLLRCRCAHAQGTKACLGWEGSPEGGTYACTAVIDTWFELLQTAFCAVRRLPRGVTSPANSRRATAELDVRLSNTLASYSGALQDLLRQLLQHWKV